MHQKGRNRQKLSLIIVCMIDFWIDGKICRFKLAKTLLSGKIQMGTELSLLTRGTSASIGGSFERHVVSPTTKNCCFVFSLPGVKHR